MDGERFDALTRSLANGATRRAVVKTGAKLAYAAPLVAASFRLTGLNAAAAVSGGGGGSSTIQLCIGVEESCRAVFGPSAVTPGDYRLTDVTSGAVTTTRFPENTQIEIDFRRIACGGDPSFAGFDVFTSCSGQKCIFGVTYYDYALENPPGCEYVCQGCLKVEQT